MALATIVSLCTVFVMAGNNAFLMPGPLQSAHGSINECSTCHTKSGKGKLSWLHGLVAGDPLADSKACLGCHKMPETAFNAHGATGDALQESTERLSRYAAKMKAVPATARAQSVAFPTRAMMARGLFCATCHHEHQGAQHDLKKITNGQCRSCHVVKFDSFDGHHPAFSQYPFKRRTRIIYDHAGHFGKHYPEVARKEPSKRVPDGCASCHDSKGNRRVMAVAPFDRTCSTCHLGQITGVQRATGPKGIAFLALPGIDLDTIRKRKAKIGEWPVGSEAPLTPFMKVMISRSARGRALVQAVGGIELQDLSSASNQQIKAVTDLVQEIKSLFFALISGKTSEVFGDLKLVAGAAPGSDVVADLTAGLPRDVLIATQRRYLPNLAAEIANGPGATSNAPAPPAAAAPATGQENIKTEPVPPEAGAAPEQAPEVSEAPPEPAVSLAPPLRNPQACLARLFGECLLFGSGKGTAEQLAPPQRLGGPKAAGRDEARETARPDAWRGTTTRTRVANARQKDSRASQKDNLLFPTPEEQSVIDAHRKAAGRGAQLDNAPPDGAPASAPATAAAAPVPSLGSDVDAESWAEHGGWYEQDHVIYYRPAGHKDKFSYTWLTLTGPLAPAGGKGPAASVFDALTAKDAQGSCAKCHSVEAGGRARRINFSPLTVRTKQGRFTRFIHEPHFGVIGKRGCMSCHELEKGRSYLKSYEQGDPRKFDAQFSAVQIDTCRTCHSDGKARQDCVLCHKYHVHDIVTPMPKTKLDPP